MMPQMLQLGSLLLSLHANPMLAEYLPVHPTQGRLCILMPNEDNVSMSKVLLKPELFMLLSSLEAALLLTVSLSQPSECWSLIALFYSTSCYKELKNASPFGAHYEQVVLCLFCRSIHVPHK